MAPPWLSALCRQPVKVTVWLLPLCRDAAEPLPCEPPCELPPCDPDPPDCALAPTASAAASTVPNTNSRFIMCLQFVNVGGGGCKGIARAGARTICKIWRDHGPGRSASVYRLYEACLICGPFLRSRRAVVGSRSSVVSRRLRPRSVQRLAVRSQQFAVSSSRLAVAVGGWQLPVGGGDPARALLLTLSTSAVPRCRPPTAERRRRTAAADDCLPTTHYERLTTND